MSLDGRLKKRRGRRRIFTGFVSLVPVLALAFAACLGALPGPRDPASQDAPETERAKESEKSAPPEEDTLPPDNTLCYVCHLDLQEELIATAHLEEEITCADCHGLSADHMHDEMLMTTPDILFGRTEVNDFCKDCHDSHEHPEKVQAFLEKWRGRDRPNGRVITEKSICTDCHGRHNIVKKMGSKKEEQKSAEMTALFNGQDLNGWHSSGASWIIKRGRIVGTPGTKNEGGDLWTRAEYADFLLAVTFRIEGPIHAGIWLRSTEGNPGLRIEICSSQKPLAYTGSIRLGKNLALANLREDLLDQEGWNTLSVEARGGRIQVWLNGEEIGAVKVKGPDRGRLGIHLEGGKEYNTAKLSVSEVQVQPLKSAEDE